MRFRLGRQHGFTWIELLMVLGVLGALALLAVPALQESTVKRQVKDAMAIADLAKRAVQGFYSVAVDMPANNVAAGIPPSDKIVSNLVKDVAVDKGAVTLTFGNSASRILEGKKLTLRPAIVAGQPMVPIAWVCHSAKVPANMEAKGTDTTNLEDKYMPLECRNVP